MQQNFNTRIAKIYDIPTALILDNIYNHVLCSNSSKQQIYFNKLYWTDISESTIARELDYISPELFNATINQMQKNGLILKCKRKNKYYITISKYANILLLNTNYYIYLHNNLIYNYNNRACIKSNKRYNLANLFNIAKNIKLDHTIELVLSYKVNNTIPLLQKSNSYTVNDTLYSYYKLYSWMLDKEKVKEIEKEINKEKDKERERERDTDRGALSSKEEEIFGYIWEINLRKESKEQARKTFKKLMKECRTVDEILQKGRQIYRNYEVSCKLWAAENRDKKYIPLLSSWLNRNVPEKMINRSKK